MKNYLKAKVMLLSIFLVALIHQSFAQSTISFEILCQPNTVYNNNGEPVGADCSASGAKCYDINSYGNPTSCEFIQSNSNRCLGRSWQVAHGMPSADVQWGKFIKMHAKQKNFLYSMANPQQAGEGTEIITDYTFKAFYKYRIVVDGQFGEVSPWLYASSATNNKISNSNCGSVEYLNLPNPSSSTVYMSLVSGNTLQKVFEFSVPQNTSFSKLGVFAVNNASNSTSGLIQSMVLFSMKFTEIAPITNNTICCDQAINTVNYNPTIIEQAVGSLISLNVSGTISYQWQSSNDNLNWSNISGANQSFYDDPNSILSGLKFYRRLASVNGWISTSNVVTVKAPDLYNAICCNQLLYANYKRNPDVINGQQANMVGNITYQWQYKNFDNWVNVQNGNGANYDPPAINWSTSYRRIMSTPYQYSVSNEVFVELRICDRPEVPTSQEVICGDQYYYNLTNGNVIQPIQLLGNKSRSSISSREFDYQWVMSTDKGNSWSNVGNGRSNSKDLDTKNYDYTPPALTYDLWYGTKEVWFQRKYAEYYDTWDCGWLGIAPCGADWHERQNSNIVRIFLSGFKDPDDLFINGPSSITCTMNSFNVSLGGSSDLGNIATVKWATDNVDWVVDPGASIWGATIRPFAGYQTGRSEATVTALITTKEGKAVTKTLKVNGPPQPVFTLNPEGTVSICNNQPVFVSVTTAVSNNVSFVGWGLTLGATTKNGNVTTLGIPATQYNSTPQNLTITVTDGNQCKAVKNITVLPRGDRWIQDRPWTGYRGPQLYAQQGFVDDMNSNIVSEGRNNIYYVGFGSTEPNYNVETPNTLLTLQWDAANSQWRNFPFPKLDPISDAAGPIALFETTSNIRTLYYVSSLFLGQIRYRQSLTGYVDEFGATTINWNTTLPLQTNHLALDMLTPVSSNRITFRATDNNLYVSNPSTNIDQLLASNVKGSNTVLIGSGLFYVSTNGQLRQVNTTTNTDVPGVYNSIVAHEQSSIAYSPSMNRMYVVNTNGQIVMYSFTANAIYVYTGAERANARGISVNKATGVLYFTTTYFNPAETNGFAYQCFFNSVDNALQVRKLDPLILQGRANDVTNTLLFTDYNLFYVSSFDSKIFMNYYLEGNCGPGITRLGDGEDTPNTVEVPVANMYMGIVPNPTSGAFDVQYTLVEEGMVQALVYNTLGELVSSSVIEWKDAGQGTIPFQQSSLSTGLYVVRLMQNGQVKAVQKLIVHH